MTRYLVALFYCEQPIVFHALARSIADAINQAADTYPNADIRNAARESRRSTL
jgi:hypothetical protein